MSITSKEALQQNSTTIEKIFYTSESVQLKMLEFSDCVRTCFLILIQSNYAIVSLVSAGLAQSELFPRIFGQQKWVG